MSVFRKKKEIDPTRFENSRLSAEFLIHENLNQSNFNNIYMRCGLHQQLDCRNCILLDDGWRPQRELLIHHSYWGYILPSDYTPPNVLDPPVTGDPNAYIVQPIDAYGSISLTLFTEPFVLPANPPLYYYYTVIGDPGFTTTTNTTFCVGQSFALSGLTNNAAYGNINSANTWYIANSVSTNVYNFSPINLSDFCYGDLIKIAEPSNLFRIEMLNLVMGTWELVETNMLTYNRYQVMVIKSCPPNCNNEHHYMNSNNRNGIYYRRNGIIAGGYDRAQFLTENLDGGNDKRQIFDTSSSNKTKQVVKSDVPSNPLKIITNPFTLINTISNI